MPQHPIQPRNFPFSIKAGVDCSLVHPQLWLYMGLISAWHKEATGYNAVWTSITRLNGKPSYHNPIHAAEQHKSKELFTTAADMRRWYFADFPALEKFVLMVKRRLDIGALIEPEWMSARQIASRGGIDKIAPHVHWQLAYRNKLWVPLP